MAALAVAPGADTDRGRQAVDDLTRQIDARYDILYEMFETAQLGATMNYAMHMSSCSFCKIRPDFSTLSPERRWRHLLDDLENPNPLQPPIRLPEILRGIRGLVLNNETLADTENIRFLIGDRRRRCQFCHTKFLHIRLGLPAVLDENDKFVGNPTRVLAIKQHRIVCPYVTENRMRLYGNMPANAEYWNPPPAFKKALIPGLLTNGDDHELLIGLVETDQNFEALGQLKKGRLAFNEWWGSEWGTLLDLEEAGSFATLSADGKARFLRFLGHIYCPKCLRKINFETEDFENHNKNCKLPEEYTRYITLKIRNLFRRYREGLKEVVKEDMILADLEKFDNTCIEMFREIRMTDDGMDFLSDEEWPEASPDERPWYSSDDDEDDESDSDDDGDKTAVKDPLTVKKLPVPKGPPTPQGPPPKDPPTPKDPPAPKGPPAPKDSPAPEDPPTEDPKPGKVDDPIVIDDDNDDKPPPAGKADTPIVIDDNDNKPPPVGKPDTPIVIDDDDDKPPPVGKPDTPIVIDDNGNKPPPVGKPDTLIVVDDDDDKPPPVGKPDTPIVIDDGNGKPPPVGKPDTLIVIDDDDDKPPPVGKPDTPIVIDDGNGKPPPVGKPDTLIVIDDDGDGDKPPPAGGPAGGLEDPIVAFYSGGKDYKGRTLKDILEFTREQLNTGHDFIQVLFPTVNPSKFSKDAPLITARTVAGFKPAVRINFLKASARITSYYGFKINQNATFTLNDDILKPDAEKKYHWLRPNDHNHLRITRIISCLRSLQFPTMADIFYKAIITALGFRYGEGYDNSRMYWAAAASGPIELPTGAAGDTIVQFYFEASDRDHKTYAEIFKNEAYNHLPYYFPLPKSPIPDLDSEDKIDVYKNERPVLTKNVISLFQTSPEMRKRQYTAYLDIINRYGFYLNSNDKKGEERQVFMYPLLNVNEDDYTWAEKDEHWELLGQLVRSLRLLGGEYEQDGIVLYNALIRLIRDLDGCGKIGPTVEALRFLRVCGQENPWVSPEKLPPHPPASSSPPLKPNIEPKEHGEWIITRQEMELENSLLHLAASPTKTRPRASSQESGEKRKRGHPPMPFGSYRSPKRQRSSSSSEDEESNHSSPGESRCPQKTNKHQEATDDKNENIDPVQTLKEKTVNVVVQSTASFDENKARYFFGNHDQDMLASGYEDEDESNTSGRTEEDWLMKEIVDQALSEYDDSSLASNNLKDKVDESSEENNEDIYDAETAPDNHETTKDGMATAPHQDQEPEEIKEVKDIWTKQESINEIADLELFGKYAKPILDLDSSESDELSEYDEEMGYDNQDEEPEGQAFVRLEYSPEFIYWNKQGSENDSSTQRLNSVFEEDEDEEDNKKENREGNDREGGDEGGDEEDESGLEREGGDGGKKGEVQKEAGGNGKEEGEGEAEEAGQERARIADGVEMMDETETVDETPNTESNLTRTHKEDRAKGQEEETEMKKVILEIEGDVEDTEVEGEPPLKKLKTILQKVKHGGGGEKEEKEMKLSAKVPSPIFEQGNEKVDAGEKENIDKKGEEVEVESQPIIGRYENEKQEENNNEYESTESMSEETAYEEGYMSTINEDEAGRSPAMSPNISRPQPQPSSLFSPDIKPIKGKEPISKVDSPKFVLKRPSRPGIIPRAARFPTISTPTPTPSRYHLRSYDREKEAKEKKEAETLHPKVEEKLEARGTRPAKTPQPKKVGRKAEVKKSAQQTKTPRAKKAENIEAKESTRQARTPYPKAEAKVDVKKSIKQTKTPYSKTEEKTGTRKSARQAKTPYPKTEEKAEIRKSVRQTKTPYPKADAKMETPYSKRGRIAKGRE